MEQSVIGVHGNDVVVTTDDVPSASGDEQPAQPTQASRSRSVVTWIVMITLPFLVLALLVIFGSPSASAGGGCGGG